jgi:hypothetical protein
MLKKSSKYFQGSPFTVGGSTRHERNIGSTQRVEAIKAIVRRWASIQFGWGSSKRLER